MALYDTNKNLIAGSRKTNIYRCNSFSEYEALPAAEKAKYDYVATPDDVPVISNMNLGSITIAADSMKSVTLADYNVNVHGKPWIAFIWNRSNWGKNIALIGDGSSTLLIYNNNAESITGNMQIAVLHSPN